MPSQEELNARRNNLERMRGMTPGEREAFVAGVEASVKYVSTIYWYLKDRSTREGPDYYKSVWENDKRGLSTAIHDLSALYSVLSYAKGKM